MNSELFKVGIIGPESSGKSTLARYLSRRYGGTYVPEYAREYIERKGTRDVTYDELCLIAKHQIEQIKNLYSGSERSERSDFCQAKPVFFDTELIVTKVWFQYAFHTVPEWLEEAIRLYPMDVYLITVPDIPWQPDPARYNGSDDIRQELYEKYEAEVQHLGIPYYRITHG